MDVLPGLTLHIVRPMPPLDPALDAVVEAHWLAACRARPLFNGRVFCADGVSPDRIEGHWTEYRRCVAQMADPLLFRRLAVRNLAVCGVLRCAGGEVVAGRRDRRSVYQAGLWQLPPAGSVDAGAATADGADWRRALLAELAEEVGLGADAVTSLRPLCLVQHPGSGVLDLGIEMRTVLTAAQVLAAHAGGGNREYDRLLAAPPALLPARVAEAGGTLVPPAHAFLTRLG